MTMGKSHDLVDFLHQVTEEMAQEYQRIQKRATEDAGTAGDQCEENWAQLLREWLPPTYQIVTKGRILSSNGSASPQVDVLVLQPFYPKHLLNKKLYFAAGVVAAFECKITLRIQHIGDVIKNAADIRKLLADRSGTPYRELYSPIIYGLLAHSHSWKGPNSEPLVTISDALHKADDDFIQHPREALDLLCVADLGTWTTHKSVELPQPGIPGSIRTGYLLYPWPELKYNPKTTALGALLSSLLKRLAWEDPPLQGFAEYFEAVGVQGAGGGRVRFWPPTIFSEIVQKKLVSGAGLPDAQTWDEWDLS